MKYQPDNQAQRGEALVDEAWFLELRTFGACLLLSLTTGKVHQRYLREGGVKRGKFDEGGGGG